MNHYNEYQYRDLLIREQDPYAEKKYRLIADCLKDKRSLHILNAGCGSGELSFLLSDKGHRVFGIDPAEEYIGLARTAAERKGLKDCVFEVSSIENFTDKDQYDCVIATDVLEHIEADYSALAKLSRLVKPGGMLIVTVPALEFLFGYHDRELGHFRRYSKLTLRRLINSQSLLEIRILRYFGFTLIPICLLFSRILKRSYPIGPRTKGFGSAMKKYVLNFLLFLDSCIPMPFGTSLLCVARKKQD
ncbi:MAG: class I SAM-dependent methyltransferase [Candidatus Magasanikbacteria bacterium]|nr:class I SAM-dependent methyltransferase [Candidatus Magasanikbacteria bacterium]